MKSESLDLHMRPGGKDLDRVNTHAPGTLEFLPNQIARHARPSRRANGYCLWREERDSILPRLERLHRNAAVGRGTQEEKGNLRPSRTPSSKVIDATFDDKGDSSLMKQTDDFHYTEGVRKAQCRLRHARQREEHHGSRNHARISDDTGTTVGDHIQMQQSTGDFDASGHVATTRLPDARRQGHQLRHA